MRNSLFAIFALCLCGCSHLQGQIPYPTATFTTSVGKDVCFYMITHGSIALSYDGYLIQIDPVKKNDGKAIDYSVFPKADAVLVSHEHFDHLDASAIREVSKSDTRVYVNAKGATKLSGSTAVGNGDKVQLTDHILVEFVPAYNTTPGHLNFHPKGNGNGFLIHLDGFTIYVSGDTEFIEEMRHLPAIDVAFLSTNQPYTMTPEQCIESAKVIHPKTLIPYHLGNTKVDAVTEGLKAEGIEVRIFETLR